MDVNEIAKIGKVEPTPENLEILEKYKNYIIPWVSSDEFKENWANKAFAPLIDPNKMDYEGSVPEHAWLLNLPLPKYYEFVVFGSHACGLHAAIPAFLSLCGAKYRVMVCRSDSLANKLTNKQNYLRMYKELCALNSVKSSFEGTIYLQVSDLIIDEDAKNSTL